MKIAVIYQDSKILVEFPPDVFMSMLKTKMDLDDKQTQKLDEAMSKIIKELKEKTLCV